MQESPFYQVVLERGREEGREEGRKLGMERSMELAIERSREAGREQGARQANIENTLNILRDRFPDTDTDALKPVFEAVDALNYLKALTLKAALAPNFRAFREYLEAILPAAAPRVRVCILEGGTFGEVIRSSPFYEVVLERGRERGRKKVAILNVLEHRFGDLPQPLTAYIDETRCISRLNDMFEEAIKVESLEELDWGPPETER